MSDTLAACAPRSRSRGAIALATIASDAASARAGSRSPPLRRPRHPLAGCRQGECAWLRVEPGLRRAAEAMRTASSRRADRAPRHLAAPATAIPPRGLWTARPRGVGRARPPANMPSARPRRPAHAFPDEFGGGYIAPLSRSVRSRRLPDVVGDHVHAGLPRPRVRLARMRRPFAGSAIVRARAASRSRTRRRRISPASAGAPTSVFGEQGQRVVARAHDDDAVAGPGERDQAVGAARRGRGYARRCGRAPRRRRRCRRCRPRGSVVPP